jgi:hypothetical protein
MTGQPLKAHVPPTWFHSPKTREINTAITSATIGAQHAPPPDPPAHGQAQITRPLFMPASHDLTHMPRPYALHDMPPPHVP